MIITGAITLVNAAAYWCVTIVCLTAAGVSLTCRDGLLRFLFPDSPTNAWFLTPDERAKAVQRIKVCILDLPMGP